MRLTDPALLHAIALLVALPACGKTGGDVDGTSPGGDGGAIAEGGQVGGTDSGGSGGASADAGTGGVVTGGNGAGGGAGMAGSGGASEVLSPRPPWNPPLPLAEPGWRSSTDEVCSKYIATQLHPRLWSHDGAVYLFVRHDCSGPFSPLRTYCSDPAGYGSGKVLYRNDGQGWMEAYEELGDDSAKRQGIAGTEPETLAIWGDRQCPLSIVEDGQADCVWPEPGAPPPGEPRQSVTAAAAAESRFYVIRDMAIPVGDEAIHEYTVQQYADGVWSSLGSLPERGTALAARGEAVVAAGRNYVAVRATANDALALIPGVPAGDYHGAWIYAPNDIVLGNTLGHLVRYDGARWTVTDTGTGESVFRLWGADDGTLFFITPTYFGRVVGTQVDLFRIIAEGEPPQSVGPGGSGTFDSFPPSHDIFQDLWGNSSTEVFVGVHAAGFAENRCGGVFALWFDGEAFHVF